MIRVYLPGPEDRTQLCHPRKETEFLQVCELINGTPRSRDWHPPEMELIVEDEGHDLVYSDSPWFSHNALILSPRALESIENTLIRWGEMLPINSNPSGYKMFNPTLVLDALDEDQSAISRFTSGRVMKISSYVFRPELVKDVEVFKIPNLRLSPTFLSQTFVDRWHGAGLVGLTFKLCFEG